MMTWNQSDGGRWGDCSRGLVPGTRKCGDQKISGGRTECEADGNRRKSGVDGKEHRAVFDQTDTMAPGRSEICKQGEVVGKQSFVQQGLKISIILGTWPWQGSVNSLDRL